MNAISMQLLRAAAKNGEISLEAALRIGVGRTNDHRDQYPLARLLEDGYLGCTLGHTPPDGAENMREYSQAVYLHIFLIPKNHAGVSNYLGIESHGSVVPENEKIFLKAKGALYLDEHDTKKKERLFALFLGVAGAFLGAWFATWIR